MVYIQARHNQVKPSVIIRWDRHVGVSKESLDISIRNAAASFNKYLPPCSEKPIVPGIKPALGVVGHGGMPVLITPFKKRGDAQPTSHCTLHGGILEAQGR